MRNPKYLFKQFFNRQRFQLTKPASNRHSSDRRRFHFGDRRTERCRFHTNVPPLWRHKLPSGRSICWATQTQGIDAKQQGRPSGESLQESEDVWVGIRQCLLAYQYCQLYFRFERIEKSLGWYAFNFFVVVKPHDYLMEFLNTISSFLVCG